MATPNLYRITDDTGASAGPTGATAGSTSGQPLVADFIAPTLANAAQIAHLISSVLQRPVRWGPVFGLPPFTLMVGVPCTNALTSVPSGITF